MTRLSLSPNPQLRAAKGCCRTIILYSEEEVEGLVDGCIAFLDELLLLWLSELSRFEMLMDLASWRGDALGCVLGGLCGPAGEAERPCGPGM